MALVQGLGALREIRQLGCAFCADGNALAVAAPHEEGPVSSDRDVGMVYAYARSGTTWTFDAAIRPYIPVGGGMFESGVSFSADGNTIAIGWGLETSGHKGVAGFPHVGNFGPPGDDIGDGAADASGAVEVLTRTPGMPFTLQAIIKASDNKTKANFGCSVSLAGDGYTLGVGSCKGTTGHGAAYTYSLVAGTWTETSILYASNTTQLFGASVALSSDGKSLVVGSPWEQSNATGINGNQADVSANHAGAVYAFSLGGGSWSQTAYVKATNTRANALFGTSTALSSDGTTLVVGSPGETSASTGINGDQNDTSLNQAGAAYVY